KAMTGRGPITRVVHVNEAPYDVYRGRANNNLPESPWHNPFRIGDDGPRENGVEAYHDYLVNKPSLLQSIRSLQGKTLGCWCKSRKDPDTLCHGDVLAALAEGKPWTAPLPAQPSLF